MTAKNIEPAAPAETPTEAIDWETRIAAYQAERAGRFRKLQRDASAVYRAMDGWDLVRSEDAWQEACCEAHRSYQSGRFLIERLGAERYLDPEQMATLWQLRQQLIEDWQATQTHEQMLVDSAVIAYAHLLRFNQWIGNTALLLEREFFGQPSSTGKWPRSFTGDKYVTAEELADRLPETLFPLLDRAHRLMTRSLKALRDLRQLPSPTVSVGSATQVNIGAIQANQASGASEEDAPSHG